MADRKIEKSEWIDILSIMNRYNRDSGYINDDLHGRLTFFDSDCVINDCHSMFVTKEEVISFLG
jgi:hypothetical protein